MADGTIPQKPKHPGGRPSKYDKTKCTQILECGKEGQSLAEMACSLDVSRATIFVWCREYPEFLDAYTRAQEESEAFWARRLRGGLGMAPSEFQGPATLKYMAQRFPGWSEKSHVETRETEEEAETPDIRAEAREIAFLLAQGAKAKAKGKQPA